MKKFTQILMIALISLFCLQSNAQVVGIKAGFSLATMFEKDDYETYSNDYTMNPGFHVGITFDSPFNNIVSFETGLLLSTKGLKYETEEMGIPITAKLIMYYIDVPFTFKLTQDFGGGTKMFWNAGPYVGVGISGKAKATATSQGVEVSDDIDINWGSDPDNDDFSRPDMGFTFGTGFEFQSVTLGVSYDLGLLNTTPYHEDGYRAQHRVLKFSLGYRFGK